MLLSISGVIGMNSSMDDMTLIQQSQRHQLVVRELGEEIDLEIGPGEDDTSFGNAALIVAPMRKCSAEEHGESKQMGMVSQICNDSQDMSNNQR